MRQPLEILKSRSLRPIAAVVFVLGCVVLILLLVAPIFSTHPSKSAVRKWESTYSFLLPYNYSDFRGHWQSQDVGVHIFSFCYPEGLDGEEVLDSLAGRLGAYRVHQRLPGEIALRRRVTYSDPNGFDEFRFVCVPSARRVYAMFANLDSEMEVQSELVEHLHTIASAEPGRSPHSSP